MRKPTRLLAGITAGLLLATGARAEAPTDFLRTFEAQATKESPGAGGLSPERGSRLFSTTHGGEWSCVSCHTENPAAPGRHAKTGKPIDPLAPAANAERFTSDAKVEKWFKRNCNDVLGRVCTAREKGDVLAYLLTVRK